MRERKAGRKNSLYAIAVSSLYYARVDASALDRLGSGVLPAAPLTFAVASANGKWIAFTDYRALK